MIERLQAQAQRMPAQNAGQCQAEIKRAQAEGEAQRPARPASGENYQGECPRHDMQQ